MTPSELQAHVPSTVFSRPKYSSTAYIKKLVARSSSSISSRSVLGVDDQIAHEVQPGIAPTRRCVLEERNRLTKLANRHNLFSAAWSRLRMCWFGCSVWIPHACSSGTALHLLGTLPRVVSDSFRPCLLSGLDPSLMFLHRAFVSSM